MSSGLLARGPLPTWEVLASVWMHAMVIGVIVVFDQCAGPPEPPFKPEDVIMVSMGQLPKQTKAVPDRPSHTPDPVPSEAELPPVNEPAPPPPPTNSDLVLKTEQDKPDPVKEAPKQPTKEPTKEQPKAPDNSAAREAAIAKAKADAQKDRSTPEGDANRPRTDPNGGEFVPGELIGVHNADPETARYIKAVEDATYPNWAVLPATIAESPDAIVVVVLFIDADGTILDFKIHKSSGNTTLDRAAKMAVAKTRKVPPPPAAWRGSVKAGFLLEFRVKDK